MIAVVNVVVTKKKVFGKLVDMRGRSIFVGRFDSQKIHQKQRDLARAL